MQFCMKRSSPQGPNFHSFLHPSDCHFQQEAVHESALARKVAMACLETISRLPKKPCCTLLQFGSRSRCRSHRIW